MSNGTKRDTAPNKSTTSLKKYWDSMKKPEGTTRFVLTRHIPDLPFDTPCAFIANDTVLDAFANATVDMKDDKKNPIVRPATQEECDVFTHLDQLIPGQNTTIGLEALERGIRDYRKFLGTHERKPSIYSIKDFLRNLTMQGYDFDTTYVISEYDNLVQGGFVNTLTTFSTVFNQYSSRLVSELYPSVRLATDEEHEFIKSSKNVSDLAGTYANFLQKFHEWKKDHSDVGLCTYAHLVDKTIGAWIERAMIHCETSTTDCDHLYEVPEFWVVCEGSPEAGYHALREGFIANLDNISYLLGGGEINAERTDRLRHPTDEEYKYLMHLWNNNHADDKLWEDAHMSIMYTNYNDFKNSFTKGLELPYLRTLYDIFWDRKKKVQMHVERTGLPEADCPDYWIIHEGCDIRGRNPITSGFVANLDTLKEIFMPGSWVRTWVKGMEFRTPDKHEHEYLKGNDKTLAFRTYEDFNKSLSKNKPQPEADSNKGGSIIDSLKRLERFGSHDDGKMWEKLYEAADRISGYIAGIVDGIHPLVLHYERNHGQEHLNDYRVFFGHSKIDDESQPYYAFFKDNKRRNRMYYVNGKGSIPISIDSKNNPMLPEIVLKFAKDLKDGLLDAIVMHFEGVRKKQDDKSIKADEALNTFDDLLKVLSARNS